MFTRRILELNLKCTTSVIHLASLCVISVTARIHFILTLSGVITPTGITQIGIIITLIRPALLVFLYGQHFLS